MAASPHGDRTEKPTEKRKRDARRRGQVARSRDLAGAVSLLAATLAIGWLAAAGASAAAARLIDGLRAMGDSARTTLTPDALASLGFADVRLFFWFIGPPAVVACVASLVASAAQTRFALSPQALTLKWERLSPAQGVKKLAALQGGAELVKTIVGLTALIVVCYRPLRDLFVQAPTLVTLVPAAIAGHAWQQFWSLLWRAGLLLAGLAVADYGLQYWRWWSQVRMTRQEVKDEYKANEGNPEIKARVRRIQRDMSRRRMLHAVKTATVVVTNPTHVAVALMYRRTEMPAPVVVAKGQDLMAARIRKVALAHGVPIVENVPLARALHRGADVGDTIPAPLFGAVAEVLAYLVRARQIIL